MVAVLAGVLLLPALAGSQQTSAAPAQQKLPAATQEEQQQPVPQKKPAAPAAPEISGPYPVMSHAALERGRQLFEMFNNVQTGQMWAALSEPLRKASGKEEKFSEINKKLRESMGTETQLLGENLVPYMFGLDTVYARLSLFSKIRLPVISVVTFNQRGEIDIFPMPKVMYEIAEGRYAGYEDTAKLILPFRGEWLVYQGGRDSFESVYAGSDDLRYAVDFVLTKDGRLFSGQGKLEDYYCFGQPILAPADGTVVKAIGTFDDYPPGKPLGDPPDGNVVIIAHGNGEASVFNHLKQNSLKVKLDDKVKQGDVIAECGNSGMGLVPRVHYRLQRSAGVPLPAQFVNYIANGKPVASGEPKRGQFVKNGAPAPAAAPSASAPGAAAPAKTPAPASK